MILLTPADAAKIQQELEALRKSPVGKTRLTARRFEALTMLVQLMIRWQLKDSNAPVYPALQKILQEGK